MRSNTSSDDRYLLLRVIEGRFRYLRCISAYSEEVELARWTSLGVSSSMSRFLSFLGFINSINNYGADNLNKSQS